MSHRSTVQVRPRTKLKFILVLVRINMNWKQEVYDFTKKISTGIGYGLGGMVGIYMFGFVCLGIDLFLCQFIVGIRYLKLKHI